MVKHKPANLAFRHLFLFFSSSFLVMSFGHLLSIADDPEADGDEIHTYIVHVNRPKHRFRDDPERENWHRSFLPNTTLDSGEPRLVYSYRDAIGGFAARLTADEARDMQSVDGIVHARRDERLPLATTYTPSFLGLRQWDGLWFESTYGKGVVIGVADSGIAPSHPSFNDRAMLPPPTRWKGQCGFLNVSFCNKKLIGATVFHGGHRPWEVDDINNGHGTHTAAIAAGSFIKDAEVCGNAGGRASGMAPRAHLAIYKVCSEDGCNASDLLAGIDQAIRDGVDVLSVSIGRDLPVPLYDDVVAIGLLAAATKGILACLPAGNFGPYSSLISNDAPWIFTVGASTIDRRIVATVRLGNGMELDGESAYQPRTDDSALLPIVFPDYQSYGSHKDCRNGSFDGIDVKGKIVLCVAGGIKNIDKGQLVKRAGGAAMIILNPFDIGSTTFAEVHALPVAHLSFSDALKMISYFKSTPTPKATIVFGGTKFEARPSPAVASFSSRGPSLMNGGILKPDIIGPGVNILSPWPIEVGPCPTGSSAFNFVSGTSVASAHLSGIAALLKSTHRNWSPAAIKSAIMTTANRLDHDEKPMVDEYNFDSATLFAMGAGLVNASSANDPGLVYDLRQSDYINYLCGLGYTKEQLTVITQRRIKCSKASSAEQLNYPSISASIGPNIKKNITRYVTNVGKAKSAYTVQIKEPKGVWVDVYPLRLQFSKRNQKKKFYVGFRTKGVPLREGEVSEGQLMWISKKHAVRSPISITFL